MPDIKFDAFKEVQRQNDASVDQYIRNLEKIHKANEKLYGFQNVVIQEAPADATVEAPEAAVNGNKYASLRDMTFADYVGQEDVVQRLKTSISAAMIQGRAMPHAAFIGPPGTGKTSLAACCAHELGRAAISVVGSEIRDITDIASMVKAVGDGLLFIDEAHDMKRPGEVPVESIMLTLLEDFRIGPCPVMPFTCILATTDYGLLNQALQSRMGLPYLLKPYNAAEMAQIALYHADKQHTTLDEGAAADIGRRSRSNPRFCKWLVQAGHNVSVVKGHSSVTLADCVEAFATLGIDAVGMGDEHRKLILQLAEDKMSIANCAMFMDLDRRSFERDVYPFLFKMSYILKSTKGVYLSEKGKGFAEKLAKGE